MLTPLGLIALVQYRPQNTKRFIKGALVLGAGLLAASALAALGQEESTFTVQAKVKPPLPWKAYPTRTIDQLSSFPKTAKADPLSTYGGLKSGKPATATGYFRTQKVGGRWWLIDPEGWRFLHVGVASVRRGGSQSSKQACASKFGQPQAWAQKTAELLHENGFNGAGAWSETDLLRSAPKPVVYTQIWSFMANYGKKRGGTYPQPGHTGYPNGCIFVFDPEFETFCDQHAKQLAATSRDPWLLGHFSDNEMPLDEGMLDRYLQLPASDPGHQAAQSWLQKRGVSLDSPTTATLKDRQDFLEYATERYFSIVSKAIRKYDPNHLYLGARFNGASVRLPQVVRAAGRHVDVLSFNYYHAWGLNPERSLMWDQEAGKPFIVSEFYAKGEDSGLGNTTGAGWIVKTQKERGLFYQNYVLSLIEARNCVGWHWFRYMDNDPADKASDASNQDSNKGIVSYRYEPWGELLGGMKELNTRVYSLARYFDKASKQTSASKEEERWQDDSTSPPRLIPPPGVVIEQNVSYLAPGRNEKLDLYYAANRPKGKLSPGVVIIHGGGWSGGDKSARREYVTGTALAKAGYVCVSLEYMKEDGKRWPTNVLDCKNGVRWLRKNAQRLQVDPEHIGVIGGSAGGHLALMTAYTSKVSQLEPEDLYPGISDRVQACVNMYGISDLVTRQGTEKNGAPNGKLRSTNLFPETREQDIDKWKLASPVCHIGPDTPPTLTLHGIADTTVDRDQAKELDKKLAEKGVEHQLILLEGVGHAFPLDADNLPKDLRPTVIEFFDKHLKK